MTKRLLRITTVPLSLHKLLGGQLAFMRANGYEVIAVSANGPEAEAVRKEGATHVVIPFTRAITPFKDFWCLIQLILLIRRTSPDIVHTHTPKAGLLGMLAAWICGVPVRMHTVAGIPWMESGGLKRFVLKLTERVTYACAHCIYPNSAALSSFIQHQFPSLAKHPGKLKIIGRGSSNGIDTTFFNHTEELERSGLEIRKRFNIPTDAIVFCFVGRVVKDKGIVELSEAFKRMLSDTKTYLLMVGELESSLDPLPESTLEFLKQTPVVILAGFQQDVRSWLAASDIFVFPSYREGFPNVVMQASCMKVPCIVSNINGCNELIEHGKSGLIVPVKDISSLHQAMRELAGNKVHREAYAEKARAYIAENFSQSYVWQELLKEYSTLTRNSE